MKITGIFVFITIAIALFTTVKALSTYKVCASSNACRPEEICFGVYCLDPCENAHFENTDCIVENHVLEYRCHDGYEHPSPDSLDCKLIAH